MLATLIIALFGLVVWLVPMTEPGTVLGYKLQETGRILFYWGALCFLLRLSDGAWP